MADFNEPLFGTLKGKFRKWVDLGDGTHAPTATLGAGTAIVGKVAIDQATPGTTNGVVASQPTSVAAFVTQVSAASVAAGASSVVDATATGGKRFARCVVNANKTHTVKFYGYSEDFAAITNAYQLLEYTQASVPAVSGYGGNTFLVDCSGLAYFAIVVTNDDGSNAATVTAAVSFAD